MEKKIDMKKLEKAVRAFVGGLNADPDTLKSLAEVTKDREPIPEKFVKKLILTEAEQDELYITEIDKEQGKLGSSLIASVLSVHPNNYSDQQYSKVYNKGLHKMSLKELGEAIQRERAKHGIYYDDYYEDYYTD